MAVVFIEHLSLRVWFFNVWPHLVVRRLSGAARVEQCFVFDANQCSLWLAGVISRMLGCKVLRLKFRRVDVQDDAGNMIEERLRFFDLFETQEAMRDIFRASLAQYDFYSPIRTFLEKEFVAAVRRHVLLVQVSLWKAKKIHCAETPTLFIACESGFSAIAAYAKLHGVQVVGFRKPWRPINFLRHLVGWEGVPLFRSIRHYLAVLFILLRWWLTKNPRSCSGFELKPAGTKQLDDDQGLNQKIKLALQQYGQLHLESPEKASDLFFWQQSEILAEDMLVLLNSRRSIQDEQGMDAAGISRLALSPQGLITSKTPSYIFWSDIQNKRLPSRNGLLSSLESLWLTSKINAYHEMKSYWKTLFSTEQVKIFCTWQRFNAQHCPITDALRECGGIMAMYPRAYNPHPCPLTAVSIDVCFSYSKLDADVERRSYSNIPYHVVTGFIGDHRFSLVKPEANRVRMMLQGNGAKKIIALFDENSGDDPRWHTDHEFTKGNYIVLLEKVLQEPWLALVIKPKVPGTLRRRLGDVTHILDRAIATGRCYIYEESGTATSYSPAIAALSADIAVHAHLCAGTAGVESALAGVPTLLVDREGWSVSPLYELGVGRVVFRDWDTLWNACLDHWASPGGIPGFGSWASIINTIDPFRDGRAAERMGTYLKWILDDLKDGLSREMAMANAAERYCMIWGQDKISEVSRLV